MQRWLKYRRKGGSFSGREDIAKLYGLEDSTYRRILPYFAPDAAPRLPGPTAYSSRSTLRPDGRADVDPSTPSSTTAAPNAAASVAGPTPPPPNSAGGLDAATSTSPEAAAPVAPVDTTPVAQRRAPDRVELNSCTPVELEALRGIGPFYAQQIIDYRDRLGGFTSEAQFGEVPKVPDSVFAKLSERLAIDLTQVRKIRINAVTAEQLGLNPYLTRRQASTIVAYRDNHGAFATEDDLLATVVLTPKLIGCLGAYLDFSLGAATGE